MGPTPGRRPVRPPIGLQLARAARVVSRGFDEALGEVGGSLPVWLILLNVKTRRLANQRELAEAIGITGATLTHHLNAMERQGLINRSRDPGNRRAHLVELTAEGEAAFERQRSAAVSFDRRLRRGLGEEEVEAAEDAFDRLVANAGGGDAAGPWAGLIETRR